MYVGVLISRLAPLHRYWLYGVIERRVWVAAEVYKRLIYGLFSLSSHSSPMQPETEHMPLLLVHSKMISHIVYILLWHLQNSRASTCCAPWFGLKALAASALTDHLFWCFHWRKAVNDPGRPANSKSLMASLRLRPPECVLILPWHKQKQWNMKTISVYVSVLHTSQYFP